MSPVDVTTPENSSSTAWLVVMLHHAKPHLCRQIHGCTCLQGEGCGVWQHCACVGVDATALPKHFWCETCTVQRADPFWRAISHHQLMPPARLLPSLHPGMATPGSTEGGAQTLERIFMLSQATLEPLRRSNDHQLQVALLLLCLWEDLTSVLCYSRQWACTVPAGPQLLLSYCI